jgi:hypothetical protein
MKAIWKVTSVELLPKQTMRKKLLCTKNMYILSYVYVTIDEVWTGDSIYCTI